MKYRAEGLLSREDLFQYFYFLQQSPSWDNCAYQSRSDCSDDVYMQNFSRVRTLLNSVVDEIWWDERLSPYNRHGLQDASQAYPTAIDVVLHVCCRLVHVLQGGPGPLRAASWRWSRGG